MPSISGLDDKIDAVLVCYEKDTSTIEMLTARALLSNLRGNSIKFDNDIETREQAERRVIDYSIRNINHSNCSSCMALTAAL